MMLAIKTANWRIQLKCRQWFSLKQNFGCPCHRAQTRPPLKQLSARHRRARLRHGEWPAHSANPLGPCTLSDPAIEH